MSALSARNVCAHTSRDCICVFVRERARLSDVCAHIAPSDVSERRKSGPTMGATEKPTMRSARNIITQRCTNVVACACACTAARYKRGPDPGLLYGSHIHGRMKYTNKFRINIMYNMYRRKCVCCNAAERRSDMGERASRSQFAYVIVRGGHGHHHQQRPTTPRHAAISHPMSLGWTFDVRHGPQHIIRKTAGRRGESVSVV